ncbi:uncharacterized protein CLUP02_10476 [Colletotrichum lupini]|uniref:Uncharacterized protein n=1 Tax=Colletotrichum lupini TaxID=145971 RepID=A0A9Q8WJL2_9PEZI|nr:uncharacterized protein CLUP02_10476 [Colletotrichum lupini]UQC84980.1 hypothetical protein CLUP02_10476 [Colletotrichum lupini]
MEIGGGSKHEGIFITCNVPKGPNKTEEEDQEEHAKTNRKYHHSPVAPTRHMEYGQMEEVYSVFEHRSTTCCLLTSMAQPWNREFYPAACAKVESHDVNFWNYPKAVNRLSYALGMPTICSQFLSLKYLMQELLIATAE